MVVVASDGGLKIAMICGTTAVRMMNATIHHGVFAGTAGVWMVIAGIAAVVFAAIVGGSPGNGENGGTLPVDIELSGSHGSGKEDWQGQAVTPTPTNPPHRREGRRRIVIGRLGAAW